MKQRARILIVDDELPVCKSIAGALHAERYDVTTSLSADEALAKLAGHPYDMVITDLMMPGMSGMELLEKIHDTHPETAVIMITGYPSVRSAVQAVKLGAFDYLPKPFTPNELRSLVARARTAQENKKQKKNASVPVTSPEGLHCIPDNTWVRVEPDGRVRVGVHHLLLNSINAISSLELPNINEMRYQGEACAIINDTDGHVVRLWTPVSGRIVEVNQHIENNTSLLREQPYRDGWLFIIMPTHLEDELGNLVPLTG